MAIYVQIEGIEGTTTEKGHEKWIQASNFTWGVSRPIITEAGRVADRGNTKPNFSEINLSKNYDNASPKLFTWSTAGTGKKVTIHFTQADGTNYMEIMLESVIPSAYSMGAGPDGDPSESISLNYTKMEVKRIPTDKQGKAQSPVVVGYDLSTMRPC